jgi:hypothetical protein
VPVTVIVYCEKGAAAVFIVSCIEDPVVAYVIKEGKEVVSIKVIVIANGISSQSGVK